MTLQRIIVGKQFKEIQVPSESIYNLITHSTEVRDSQPRYQSKHRSATKTFYESVKKPHQTMGYGTTPLKSPKEYLKKQTRDFKHVKESQPFCCLNEGNKKPPVPKLHDVPVILHEAPNKDFVRLNALSVLKTPALMPTPKVMDTRRGDSFILEFSGLVPKFLKKEEFGKTPKYLVQRRKCLEYSKEMFEKSIEDQKPIMLSEEEKNSLIEGLRANWEEFNTRYLALPLVTDTKTLQHRKLELERKLNALEQDIFFLEKNRDVDIYVLPE